MNSLTTVANGRIIRERRFAIFAASDLASTLAGTTAALAAAFAGWGAWSLVVQQLVLWSVKTFWVTRAAGTPVRAHYRFSEAKALLLFGVHSIGAMLADFVARNLDSLIVGATLGATLLGYYAMGYQIARMPDMLITGPFYLYIFTAVSRRLHDSGPGGTGDLAVGALRLGSAALAPLFCGLALVADLAVPLLLGSKWDGAVVPLRNLAGAGFSFCMCSLMAAVLMGLGKAALRLKLSVLLGVITIATVAATVRFGLETVSAAAALAMAAVFAIYLVVLTRDLKVSFSRALPALVPAVAASAVMAAVVLGVRAASAGLPEAAQLVLAILAGAASYPAVLAALARRRLLADARAFASAQADRVEPEAVERIARRV
jgi:O-antigen/teichoic acid export membrane protein